MNMTQIARRLTFHCFIFASVASRHRDVERIVRKLGGHVDGVAPKSENPVQQPYFIFIDAAFPETAQIDFLMRLKKTFSRCSFIVFAQEDDVENIAHAFDGVEFAILPETISSKDIANCPLIKLKLSSSQ